MSGTDTAAGDQALPEPGDTGDESVVAASAALVDLSSHRRLRTDNRRQAEPSRPPRSRLMDCARSAHGHQGAESIKHLAIALAAVSSLVLFSPPSEARPFGRGHGFVGHHHGFHGFRGHQGVGFRNHYRRYRGVGFRSARFGYGRRYGYRGLGLAAGLGLGLAAAAARPAYYGGSYSYGYPYAPVGYRYGYGVGRPYCGCGY